MKTYSNIMMAVTLPMILLACTYEQGGGGNPPTAQVNPANYVSEFKLCRNSDSNQPASNDSLQNVYDFRQVIPTEMVRLTKCNGEVREMQNGEREFSERIMILPPYNLRSRVQSVKIYNHLNCGKASVSMSNRDVMKPIYMAKGKVFEMPLNMSQLSKRGLLKLTLADGEFREGYDKLNVVNGRNVLEVVYYGRNAEEVGRKLVTVNVSIERPIVPGVRNAYEENCEYKNHR